MYIFSLLNSYGNLFQPRTYTTGIRCNILVNCVFCIIYKVYIKFKISDIFHPRILNFSVVIFCFFSPFLFNFFSIYLLFIFYHLSLLLCFLFPQFSFFVCSRIFQPCISHNFPKIYMLIIIHEKDSKVKTNHLSYFPLAIPRTGWADAEASPAVPPAPGEPCGEGPAGGGWHPRQGADCRPQLWHRHCVRHPRTHGGAHQHRTALPPVL